MVRFADGPTTEVTRVVAADPEAVWPLVTDIALPAEASDELQQATWVEGDGPRVGAVFEGHNARGDSRWTTRCTVTEADAPRTFTWRVMHGEEEIATWGFTLSPAAEGGTLVRQWTRLGPGRSGLTWAIRQDPDHEEEIIAARLAQLQASMARNLDVVARRLAEAPLDRP